MINVVNKFKEPNHIYCGRGSALGNPFPMKGETQRDAVCNQYEDWFYSVIDEPNFLAFIEGHSINWSPQMKMLRQIYNKALVSDVNLGCFCSPKRCHCDTIKHFIECKIEESLK